MQRLRRLGHALIGQGLIAIAALTATTRAEIDATAVRESLVLPAEPAGAVSLAAARGTLGLEPKPVVVAGRIGGKGMEPFLEGKASFSLLEIPEDDHAEKPGHNADDCPFCKKRQANATMAAVQFLGPDGKPAAECFLDDMQHPSTIGNSRRAEILRPLLRDLVSKP